MSFIGAALGSKMLDLLRELVPAASITMLVNSKNKVTETERSNVEAAGLAIKQKIQILDANTEEDFDAAFATLAQQQNGALLVATDAFFFTKRDRLSVGGTAQDSRDLRAARVCGGRRPHELRPQPY